MDVALTNVDRSAGGLSEGLVLPIVPRLQLPTFMVKKKVRHRQPHMKFPELLFGIDLIQRVVNYTSKHWNMCCA